MDSVCDSATSRFSELGGVVRRCLTSAGSADIEKPAIAPVNSGMSLCLHGGREEHTGQESRASDGSKIVRI